MCISYLLLGEATFYVVNKCPEFTKDTELSALCKKSVASGKIVITYCRIDPRFHAKLAKRVYEGVLFATKLFVDNSLKHLRSCQFTSLSFRSSLSR